MTKNPNAVSTLPRTNLDTALQPIKASLKPCCDFKRAANLPIYQGSSLGSMPFPRRAVVYRLGGPDSPVTHGTKDNNWEFTALGKLCYSKDMMRRNAEAMMQSGAYGALSLLWAPAARAHRHGRRGGRSSGR